ncbi:MAG: rhodanese-like domain-containing protein [Proteobacteria bacterium]|nr:rhodanese-like domain-containing protein [Pseudomonadota bacterium]
MKAFGFLGSLVILAFLLAPEAGAQESPLRVDGATTVDAATAKTLFDRGVGFVDVRGKDLWEAGHIPGAAYLDLFSGFNEDNLLKVAAKDQEVVIYCAGPGCKRSGKACAKAVSWGFEKVYYFRPGYPAWRAAGFPTDPP